MRHASTLLRCCRALVGLVTLWCLGCSSFEPIMGSLLGNGRAAAMACASDIPSGSGAAAAAAGDRVAPTVSAPSDNCGFDCGCGGSCHAPSPTLAVRDVHAPPVRAVDQAPPGAPASISRAPLLPPPESVT